MVRMESTWIPWILWKLDSTRTVKLLVLQLADRFQQIFHVITRWVVVVTVFRLVSSNSCIMSNVKFFVVRMTITLFLILCISRRNFWDRGLSRGSRTTADAKQGELIFRSVAWFMLDDTLFKCVGVQLKLFFLTVTFAWALGLP